MNQQQLEKLLDEHKRLWHLFRLVEKDSLDSHKILNAIFDCDPYKKVKTKELAK